MIPEVFPDKPASEADYSLIETITSSKTWVAPEDGWFLVDVVSASGSGGSAWYNTYQSSCACTSGGGEVPELVRDQSSRLPKDNLSPSLLVVMPLLGVI